MKVEIATPISHLFQIDADAELISKRSDCLEFRDHSRNYKPSEQKLFHCELQPIHEISEKNFDYLTRVRKEKVNLEVVSFHMASCFEKPKLEGKIYVTGDKKRTKKEMLEFAKINFKRIRQIFGPKVKIAIENNNYYPTEAYEIVCDPIFINEIVTKNDIFFLFDIAHAQVSSYNMNTTYLRYCADLPLSRCIQVHICKSGTKDFRAFDAHDLPGPEEFKELRRLTKQCALLKYVTIEYYRDVKALVNVLVRLKDQLINDNE